MRDIIKSDLKNILKNTIRHIQNDDPYALAEISNHTIHNASIFQDKESLTIAVIIYAISKMGDKLRLVKPQIITLMRTCIDYLNQDNFRLYDRTVQKMVRSIQKVDKKMNLYIQHIINRAEIKKGSKIYEHGISLGQTAQILGLSQWELMNYVGKTKISDNFDEEIGVMERIRFAESLFRL